MKGRSALKSGRKKTFSLCRACPPNRRTGKPKRLYRDTDDAISYAIDNSFYTGKGMRIYDCPSGKGVHLTTTAKRVS